MKDMSFKERLRALAGDSIWSIAALVMMNAVAQFVVYPAWSNAFGEEAYGNVIYVMALVNIFSVSMGVAANYARMRESASRGTANGDYNRLLLICGAASALGTFALVRLSGLGMTAGEAALAGLLSCATMWRYYADVEYRLKLNYRGYFLYYLAVSAGYLIGLMLFRATGLWPLALLPGELLGLALVLLRGGLFTDRPLERSASFGENARTVLLLIATNVISNAIFNGDRILLQLLLGGSAVTVYYLASLLGKTMSLVTTPLNSVIIGHLARYRGAFTRRMIHAFAGLTLLAVALGTAASLVGSHILVRMLYPDSYGLAKGFFLIANLTQMFYFVTNIVTTILLRIGKTNRQLTVNAVYAAAFGALCVPGALRFGVAGFCAALLAVNVIRYLTAMGFCYASIRK